MMVELVQREFNRQIMSAGARLGTDTNGEIIGPVTLDWVQEAEGLFASLQESGNTYGVIQAESLQYFLLSLLLNEINFNNKDTMPLLISKQTQTMLFHMLQI